MTLNPEQFGQLPMFVSARDIHDNYIHGDNRYTGNLDSPKETLDETYERKQVDNVETAKYSPDYAPKTVETPLDVSMHKGKPVLWNGHHRQVGAYNKNPDTLLPVIHTSEPYAWEESSEASPHYGLRKGRDLSWLRDA